MAKRLSKTLWYGTGLDTYGKPLLPPVATNESDLNGLHRGELFMHLDKDNVTLWALSSNNEVVQIAGKQGEIDIDLSDYLLKSTWDKVWELRKDNNGVEYIYSKLPVVTRYGITMYANNGEVEVESIYEGLPIDRQTLIWKDGVLMVNPELDLGGGGGIDENELRDYLTRNDYAKKSDITSALSGYATTSSLNAVSTKLNDFLEGSDTDTVINKWKELETFLSGLTESDNLATILTGKADKSYVDTNFVTIAGTEDVTGVHDFVNGLKIGGLPITKKQDDVVYLDANLVVRGGITMYAENEVDIPSIIDSLPIASTTSLGVAKFDSTYFSVGSDGKVTFIGSNNGGVADSVAWSNVTGKPSWIGTSKPSYTLNEIGAGVLTIGDGTNRIMWRIAEGYRSGVYHHTWGNESVVFANKNSATSWIFATADPTLQSNWQNLTPSLQIKNQRVVINKLIPYNQNAEYNLDVNGSFNATTGYINKNEILHAGNYNSYALPLSGGTMSGSLGITSSSVPDGAVGLWGTSTLYLKASDKVSFYNSSTGKFNEIIHLGNIGNQSVNYSNSAGKLQTSRTIWGQSFDGTSNVSGNISMGRNSIVFSSGRLCSHNANVEDNTTNIITWKGKDDGFLGYVGYYADQFIFCNYKGGAEKGGVSVYDNGNISTFGNGNFGIGTASPQAKLSVQGGIDTYRSSGDYSGAIGFNRKSDIGGLYISSYHGHQIQNYKGDLQFYIEKTDNTWLYPLVIQGSSGNVGIGTTEPTYKLHVNSTNNQVVGIVSMNKYEASIRYTNGAGNIWVAGTGAGKPGDYYGIWSNTLQYSPLVCSYEGAVIVDQFTYIAGGSIGFNRNTKYGGRFDTSYNGWQWHVDKSNNKFCCYTEGTNEGMKFTIDTRGNGLFYGGITMYSDIRKKTKLQDVELSLSQIADAPLIEHYYNSDQEKTTHVGSIAQYWAGLNDWFCKLDAEGFYTMEIQNCALASAISIARHLERYESKTDKTIRKMKQRIQELEDEVERLKKGA